MPASQNEERRDSAPTNNGCVKFSSPEATPAHPRPPSRASSKHQRTQSEASAASQDVPSSFLSSSRTSSSLECGFEPNSPDGGWGWVVVIAAFMTNLIADGVTYSFGVMYVEFLDYFKSSKGKTAWVGSLFMGIPLLAGPIASALTDRFGCRKVTIAGALLAALGFVLSSLCDSLEVLYFTFGILSGFGLALCYVAAIVIVAYYFEKRRSFATGLAVCGSGIGTFIFAPLTQYLIDEYRWQGTTLILSGFFLNIVVCGALMRDLEWTKKKYRGDKTSSENVSQKSPMPLDEKRKVFLLHDGAGNVCIDDVTSEHLKDCERLCNSLVQLPTFLKDSESLPPDVLEMLSNNRVNYQFLVDRRQSDDGRLADECLLPPASGVANCSLPTSQRAGKQQQQQRQQQSTWIKQHALPNRRLSTAHFQNLRFHRHSITHRGAMLNIHRYHLRASSCPDIYRNSMITIAQEEESVIFSFLSDLKEIMLDMIDVSYFKNVKFLIFCISNFLLYIWYDVPYIYITDNAIQMGIPQENASFLISVIGILNTIGEILLGYVGDKPWLSTTLLYAAFTALCGVVTGLVPLLSGYYSMCFVAGTFGFAISANYSLTSIIIVDLINLENFTNAYGLLLLMQGIANLIGPPLAGWMFDMTGSYRLSFYMAGLWIFVSGAMMVVLPVLKTCRRWNDERKGTVPGREDVSGDEHASRTRRKRARKKGHAAKETCI